MSHWLVMKYFQNLPKQILFSVTQIRITLLAVGGNLIRHPAGHVWTSCCTMFFGLYSLSAGCCCCISFVTLDELTFSLVFPFGCISFVPDLSAPALLTFRSTGLLWHAWKRTGAELLYCLSPPPWTCSMSSSRWAWVCVCLRKEENRVASQQMQIGLWVILSHGFISCAVNSENALKFIWEAQTELANSTKWDMRK